MSRRSVVISGASAGIGAALAALYAGADVTLGLIGRDGARLGCTADLCRAKGARVEEIALDVRDREALRVRLAAFDGAHPVDLVIANAGIALAEDPERSGTAYDVIDTNLLGALNTLLPLVAAMKARGQGQIALVSSIAALSPLPDAPAYSASKAALLAYGLALRERLRPSGVRVSVACPGFVATGMGTQYQGWRPLEISAEAAAHRIAAGLTRDRAVIAFPWPLATAARLGALVPEPLLRLALTTFRFSIERAGGKP